MKTFLLVTLLLTTSNAFSKELKNKTLRSKVTDSINEYFLDRLELGRGIGYGYLDESDISIQVVGYNKAQKKLTLKSTGVAFTYDDDFGDPVDEVEFTCISLAQKRSRSFLISSTRCKY